MQTPVYEGQVNESGLIQWELEYTVALGRLLVTKRNYMLKNDLFQMKVRGIS